MQIRKLLSLKSAGLLGLFLLVPGCVLAPKEADQERDRVKSAGLPYEKPFEKRSLPELPADPAAIDILHRGLLADGELETAYFQWAAALARINQAGAYPNTPVSVGFQQMLDKGRIKSFDQTSISVSPDAMENLAFPTKTAKAGAIATDMARAAGKQFLAVKLNSQKRLLQAWFDYVLLSEKIRIQQQNIALLRMVQQTTSSRLQAGAMPSELLKADVEVKLADDALASMQSELVQQRARLNSMLARPADAPLAAPAELPAPRKIPADDAALLAAAGRDNPELLALSHEMAGKENAIELARMQYIPDFNPSFGITGSKIQMVGLGISLPTVYPRIQGMIAEARADLGAAQATLRQKRQDTVAELVAALAMMRNSERQAAVFSQDIVPLAQRVVDSIQRSYAAGTASYLELIDAQRMLLDSRLMLSEATTAREKSLAEVEALAGFDVETLAQHPSTMPATQPAQEFHHE